MKVSLAEIDQTAKGEDMSMKSRVGQIAMIGASAVMLAASGSAQKADPANAQAYSDQLSIRSFLKDPSLIRSAQNTSWSTLVALQGGWAVDRMLVFHSAPMVNADPPCSVTTNGYIVNEAHTGHNLFNTMLMAALLNRREVAFVISGCYQDRPQIVSVSIR